MKKGQFSGSCLCGAFQFQLVAEQELLPVPRVPCKCAACQHPDPFRASDSGFSGNFTVLAKHFVVSRNDAPVTEYQLSSGVWKCFCSICGSPLNSRVDSDPDNLCISLGTLPREAQATIVAASRA